jgi:hypothetical protein
MTEMLFREGYVAGYNMPYTERIFKKLGYNEGKRWYMLEAGTYLNESRAIVLKKYHPLMRTVEDMKYWLITNEQENIAEGLAPR